MTQKKSLIIIVFLLLALLSSLFLVFRTTIFFGKAATGNLSSVTLENSYLFASPLSAKASGSNLSADRREQIRLTVFLLDSRGVGVPNQPVSLIIPTSVFLNPVQPTTDEVGKAIFDLSSSVTSRFEVAATTNGHLLPQKVTVVFY